MLFLLIRNRYRTYSICNSFGLVRYFDQRTLSPCADLVSDVGILLFLTPDRKVDA